VTASKRTAAASSLMLLMAWALRAACVALSRQEPPCALQPSQAQFASGHLLLERAAQETNAPNNNNNKNTRVY